MNWPRKVFLDSTALYQLGLRLENVDLAKLMELRDSLEFKILIPEIAWREYLRQRKKQILACLEKVRQVKNTLQEVDQGVDELTAGEKRICAYQAEFETGFNEKAAALGLTISPLPSVDLLRLAQMSLDCSPPFEEAYSGDKKTKEKGFRDALIVFTVMENIREKPEDSAYLITNDNGVAEGCRLLLDEYRTSLTIGAGFEDALKHINATLTTSYREHLRQEREKAKEVLLQFREQIDAKIGEIHEVSPSELSGGLGLRGLLGIPEIPNIEEVRSVSFGDIESAIWKDRDKPRSRILFKLRCDVRAVVGDWGVPAESPTYKVGGGKIYRGRTAPFRTFEKTFPLHMFGEAALLEQDGSWSLGDLKLEKSLPVVEEDLLSLLMAEEKRTQ